jgi:hypothetical protein
MMGKSVLQKKRIGTYRLLGALFAMLFGCMEASGVGLSKSPVPGAVVARAQFTTGIADREPTDKVVVLDDALSEIYYFTELRNLQGRKVTHRWEHDGQTISEVSFMVEGPRWRVFSKKTLTPSMRGKWTVFVVDQSGWPIHASMFKYVDGK